MATTRLPGDENGLLNEVNNIYNRQTGIFFQRQASGPGLGGVSRTLHIKEFDAASAVELFSRATPDDPDNSPHRTPNWKKIYPQHRDHRADINVFFVKSISDKAGLLSFPGGISEIVRTTRGFRDIIIDDRRLASLLFQPDTTNLAHEIGHTLGEFHNQDPQSLMSGKNAVGLGISLALVKRMRANLVQFAQK